MKITVRVTPSAKRLLIKEEDGVLKVALTAPAVDGKANKALISCLADHFGVRKSRIQIIKGLKSRDKTINIEGI
ncbi:MAG: DUF167 domain-containing protein [Candidatus Omnitrophica bacterium]|nr:DUF167 domain-containing protein [Candidatus Omnitrophota bacterium]MCB9721239.1 DUF167 domain-containing protein [Candidatus Omnitrophota bacterium]